MPTAASAALSAGVAGKLPEPEVSARWKFHQTIRRAGPPMPPGRPTTPRPASRGKGAEAGSAAEASASDGTWHRVAEPTGRTTFDA